MSSSHGITSLSGILLRFLRMLLGVMYLMHWLACIFYSASPDEYGLGGTATPSERYVLELYNVTYLLTHLLT